MASTFKKREIQIRLLRWFKRNQRDLPWRRTRDPYAIWVSEIMLQQTQVLTVIPYYQRFLRAFPSVRHLAKADLPKVLKIWEGLGYYARARNLHRASKMVLNHFKGKIPDRIDDLWSLPGVGRSTAGAILSIAYNKEAPVLDGNVKRVLSRLFAVPANPNQREREALLWNLSESLIPKDHASAFNQGLMDLGSLICTPRDPRCSRCPLGSLCKGKASGDPGKYPAKTMRKTIRHVEAVAAVIQKDGSVLLNRRPPKGLLGGLWEFPNWKAKGSNDLKKQLKDLLKEEMDLIGRVGEPVGTFEQTFSHFKLTLHVYVCYVVRDGGKAKWMPLRKLPSLPMSRLHRRIAESFQ